MPKIIELTVELEVQRVSCPGVWLCQDGRVSLTVYALGTSYQTCLLPPIFPLLFKDVFYFRKRFQGNGFISNICCLLKDETIYCELVQWSQDCISSDCVVLAQYLGTLSDVLFPPHVCSSDGVDLLMRRAKKFPGILSPKIEIATKVRIDEVWNQCTDACSSAKLKLARPSRREHFEGLRNKQVCHTPRYHRYKCNAGRKPRSRSRSWSEGSRSCCSIPQDSYEPDPRPRSPYHQQCTQSAQYSVYSARTPPADVGWRAALASDRSDRSDLSDLTPHYLRANLDSSQKPATEEERIQRLILESRYIEQMEDRHIKFPPKCVNVKPKFTPCICEICKRYHELFHGDDQFGPS